MQKDTNGEELDAFVKENTEVFENLPDDTYDTIGVFSKSKILLERKEEFRSELGGINMCKALEEIQQKAKEQGIELGIQNTIKACKSLGGTIDATLEQLTVLYSLAQNQAMGYIQKYWN